MNTVTHTRLFLKVQTYETGRCFRFHALYWGFGTRFRYSKHFRILIEAFSGTFTSAGGAVFPFFSCPSLFSILKAFLQIVKTGWGDSTFHSGFHPVIPRLCVFIKECQVDSKQLSHAVVMFLRQSSKIWLDNYNRLSLCTSWVQHLPWSLIIDRPEVCLLGEKCARMSVCAAEMLLNG